MNIIIDRVNNYRWAKFCKNSHFLSSNLGLNSFIFNYVLKNSNLKNSQISSELPLLFWFQTCSFISKIKNNLPENRTRNFRPLFISSFVSGLSLSFVKDVLAESESNLNPNNDNSLPTKLGFNLDSNLPKPGISKRKLFLISFCVVSAVAGVSYGVYHVFLKSPTPAQLRALKALANSKAIALKIKSLAANQKRIVYNPPSFLFEPLVEGQITTEIMQTLRHANMINAEVDFGLGKNYPVSKKVMRALFNRILVLGFAPKSRLNLYGMDLIEAVFAKICSKEIHLDHFCKTLVLQILFDRMNIDGPDLPPSM